MKSIYFIACIWTITHGAVLDQHKSARILKYDFDNFGLGPYRFGFESSDGITRKETGEVQNQGSKHQFVKVSGLFSYMGPDGHLYEVRYVADDQGFHPEGDHIRVPPFVPWIHHHDDDHDEEHHKENNSDQRTFTPIVEAKYTSRPNEFLPDSSTARSADINFSDVNHVGDESSHRPDPQSHHNLHFFPRPEAQTPSGYITPRPAGQNINENDGSKYYIPPINVK